MNLYMLSLSGSVQVVSKKDFYNGAPLSALFEEFEAPGITVFAKSTSGATAPSCHSINSCLLAVTIAAALLVIGLNQ